MKKFLSFAIVAVLLVASVSVVAFAQAPKAADFTVNNGFYIFENVDGSLTQTDVRDVPEMTDTDKGLKVVHGGYYWSGDNCGGVVSTGKYDLNGFEATVYFEKIPEYTTATDGWIAMDFLAAPRGFFTNNFSVENGGNQGILDLVRYSKPYVEVYEGISGFTQTYNSQSVDASVNAMFTLNSGDSLTVKVNAKGLGKYTISFARDGFADFEVPYEYDLSDVFVDGKAHFSVIASAENAPEDGWVYYITDIKNGNALTDEEKAAIEEAKQAAIIAENVEYATNEADKAEEKALEAMERATALGDEAAIEKAQEAIDAIANARAAIEERDFDLAQEESDYARLYAKEANAICKDIEEAAESKGDDKNDNNKDKEVINQNPDSAAQDSGIPAWIWIVIAAAVVVVIVVVIVLATKKKN